MVRGQNLSINLVTVERMLFRVTEIAHDLTRLYNLVGFLASNSLTVILLDKISSLILYIGC